MRKIALTFCAALLLAAAVRTALAEYPPPVVGVDASEALGMRPGDGAASSLRVPETIEGITRWKV